MAERRVDPLVILYFLWGEGVLFVGCVLTRFPFGLDMKKSVALN